MAINSLSASSYGLSGLASGINSQEMVEKLLSGTQSKINKATQKKTTLQYTQNLYREVSNKLKGLQNSFLSFSSKTNLLSSSFYNTMVTNINTPTGVSSAFSVSGSSTAQPGTVTMDYIKQLATARTQKTNVDATGKVSGNMDLAAAKQLYQQNSGSKAALIISVGGESVEIANAPTVFSGMSQSEVATYLNEKVFNKNGTKVLDAEARFVNNKLEIIAGDSEQYVTVSGNNSTIGMKMFGSGQLNLSAKGALSAAIDTDSYKPSFEVNLDGRQQTIHIDLKSLEQYINGADSTAKEAGRAGMVADINDQLQRAFGSGVRVEDTNGSLEFIAGAKSQRFTITGGSQVMSTLGLKSGVSNKLNTNMALKELNFGEALQGSQHTFKINGVEFSYSTDSALSTIINDINNSKAGVKISYVESEDRFVIQSSETGEGSKTFDVSQTQGNLMSVLFGEKSGANATGYGVITDLAGTPNDLFITDEDGEQKFALRDGGTFTFNVNGTDYKFNVTRGKDDPAYTVQSFAKAMNDAFKDTFGNMADGTQKVNFVYDTNTLGFKIHPNDGETVVKAVKYNKDNNTHSLGFTVGDSTLVGSGSAKLSDVGIDFGTDGRLAITLGEGAGKETIYVNASDVDENTTMDGLATLINDKIAAKYPSLTNAERPKVDFDTKTGAFRLMGVDIPMEIAIDTGSNSKGMTKIFGRESIAVNQKVDMSKYADGEGNVPADFATVTDQGQNAVFSINGNELVRASNTFAVDGLTYTLSATTVTDKTVKAGTGIWVDSSGDPVAEGTAGATWKEEEYDYKYQDPTTIKVSRDTDKIVTGIQEFFAMYNETIDYINSLYKADATYKSYPPLTEDQKKEMSDREIELWEEKAQEGLLRNDPLLEKVLSNLRKSMYTKPEGSSIAIYDLGISTSYYANDGNFKIESMDDLKSLIEQDPEAVRNLFAGEGGLMELVNNAITDATKSSYASPGYLTARAGSNVLDTSSSIYKEIAQVDKQLETLEDRYWSEYNRYWKQFNSMEQMIQQMNTQSSWLSQQLG